MKKGDSEDVTAGDACVMNTESLLDLICPVCERVLASGNYFVTFVDKEERHLAVLPDSEVVCPCGTQLQFVPRIFDSAEGAEKAITGEVSTQRRCITWQSFSQVVLPALRRCN